MFTIPTQDPLSCSSQSFLLYHVVFMSVWSLFWDEICWHAEKSYQCNATEITGKPSISMETEQTHSADENHVIWLKASK